MPPGPPLAERSAASGVKVERLGDGAAASERAWDRFVDSAPDGTVFHRIAWKQVVEDVFGHRPHYLVALHGDAVRAVLPLFEVRGLRAGHIMISVPYGTYGGICGTDPEAVAGLLEAARRLGDEAGARYVELRQLHHALPDLPTRRPFVTFTRSIAADPEVNLRALPPKRRYMIRKGERGGLVIRRGWEPLAEFYQVYASNRRQLGAPPFSRRMFEALRDRFGAGTELLTAWHAGRVVAGVVSFFHGDRVLPYYAASLSSARALAVNDLMYWELMCAAGSSGYRLFDFGQSHEGSGAYAFKHNWGFAPEPIAYQYVLVRDREPPEHHPSSPNPLVEVWKHLPLPLTTWLGPALIRWLPLH